MQLKIPTQSWNGQEGVNMNHLLAIGLVCLVACVAVDSYGGLYGGNEYGSRGYGGRHLNDVAGGSGGQGYNTGGSGGGINEGHRSNRFTSYTNSEHDSGHRVGGHGRHGTNAGGGGRHGRLHGSGNGYGGGRWGGSRIGSGFFG